MNNKLNVLIAEDEHAIAHALKYTINKFFDCAGIDVAMDGEEAWQLVRDNAYHLIVSDWNMPHKSGKELLMDVRSLEHTAETPFLMLTARADRESVIVAANKGANAYLVKPFEREALVSKIEQLLHVSRAAESVVDEEKGKEESPDTIVLIDKIAKSIKSGDIVYPVLPDIAFKITEALNNEEQDFDKTVEILKLEPGIVPKLIGLANSAFYKGSKRITDLEAAVVRIGMDQTKRIVLMTMNQSLYNTENTKFEALLRKLSDHATAVACCARRVAETLSLSNRETIFTMGMLHDVGKLILLNTVMESYSEINDDAIGEILNSLHGQAGAAVLKEWKLPTDVVQAALLHHDITSEETSPLPLRVVGFSNRFVRSLGFALKEADEADDVELASAFGLGLTEEQLASIGNYVEENLKQVHAAF